MATYTWDTQPGAVSGSVSLIPSGSAFYLCDWNVNKYQYYSAGSVSGYTASGISTGFIGGSTSASGDYLLSRDGHILYPETGTIQSISQAYPFRSTNNGYCLDVYGNLYSNTESLLVSGTTDVYNGLALSGSTFYSSNVLSGLVSASGSTWNLIGVPTTPYGTNVFVSALGQMASGAIGVGVAFSNALPIYGVTDVTYVNSTAQTLTITANGIDVWEENAHVSSASAAYGGNRIRVDPDGLFAIATSSSGVAFLENSAGTWSINRIVSFLSGTVDASIGSNNALVYQDTQGIITPYQYSAGTWSSLPTIPLSGTCGYIFPDNIHAVIGTPTELVYLELSLDSWINNGSIAISETPVAIQVDDTVDDGCIYVLGAANIYTYKYDSNYVLYYQSSEAANGDSFVVSEKVIFFPPDVEALPADHKTDSLYSITRLEQSLAPHVYGITNNNVQLYNRYSPDYWHPAYVGGVCIYDGTSFGAISYSANSYPVSIMDGPGGTAYAVTNNDLIFGTDGVSISMVAPSPMLSSVPIGLSAGYWDGTKWTLTASLVGGILTVTP